MKANKINPEYISEMIEKSSPHTIVNLFTGQKEKLTEKKIVSFLEGRMSFFSIKINAPKFIQQNKQK